MTVTEKPLKDEQLEGYFLFSFIIGLRLFVNKHNLMTKWMIRSNKNEKVNEIYSDCSLIINQKTQITNKYICIFKFSIESILNFYRPQNTLIGLLITVSRYLTRIYKYTCRRKTPLFLLFQKSLYTDYLVI